MEIDIKRLAHVPTDKFELIDALQNRQQQLLDALYIINNALEFGVQYDFEKEKMQKFINQFEVQINTKEDETNEGNTGGV